MIMISESKDYTKYFDFSNVPEEELWIVYNTNFSLKVKERTKDNDKIE